MSIQGGSRTITLTSTPSAPPCTQAAETLFTPLWWDADAGETVVLCLPQTGRTHQIRVHLAFTGFPIANDPMYNTAAAAALAARDAAAVARHPAPSAAPLDVPAAAVGSTAPISDAALAALCVTCRGGEAAEFNAMQRLCHGIYLHSVAYTGPLLHHDGLAGGVAASPTAVARWHYGTPIPAWAAR